jgi:drug/metabolite transporter (DMT)-like permease
MGLGVTLAVLLAAVLHAAWNALAHAVPDQLVGFVLIGLASTACTLPLVLLAPLPDGASWAFLVASAVLHSAYNLLLQQSYRLGDFNQVYPLARGTSPLLVAVAAVVLVGEHLGAVQLAGVAVVSAGLGSLVLAGGLPHADQRAALWAAAATGVAIATYTVLDGVGVRRSDTVLGYAAWLFLLQGPVVPLLAVRSRGRALVAQLRPYAGRGLLCGALSLAAYGLVLWAQARGALAAVAALRETSVIVGAGIGAVLFHERFGRARLVATVLVALGIVLLNVP